MKSGAVALINNFFKQFPFDLHAISVPEGKISMHLLGITSEDLDHIAAYETNRLNRRTVHPVQSLSMHNEPALDNETRKRSPGRPKGSKNKPKPEMPGPNVKRKPGRPKGSKTSRRRSREYAIYWRLVPCSGNSRLDNIVSNPQTLRSLQVSKESDIPPR